MLDELLFAPWNLLRPGGQKHLQLLDGVRCAVHCWTTIFLLSRLQLKMYSKLQPWHTLGCIWATFWAAIYAAFLAGFKSTEREKHPISWTSTFQLAKMYFLKPSIKISCKILCCNIYQNNSNSQRPKVSAKVLQVQNILVSLASSPLLWYHKFLG